MSSNIVVVFNFIISQWSLTPQASRGGARGPPWPSACSRHLVDDAHARLQISRQSRRSRFPENARNPAGESSWLVLTSP